MHLLEHIKNLEEKLLEPAIRYSRIDLEALLADDFIEFSSSGNSFNKAEIINALLQENEIYYVLENFKITSLSEEIILATYLAVKNKSIFSLRSSIWKFSEGQWRLVFHQGTNCKA